MRPFQPIDVIVQTIWMRAVRQADVRECMSVWVRGSRNRVRERRGRTFRPRAGTGARPYGRGRVKAPMVAPMARS